MNNEEKNTVEIEKKKKNNGVYFTLLVCALTLILGVWSALSSSKTVNEAEVTSTATTTAGETTSTATAKVVENKVTSVAKSTTAKKTTTEKQKSAVASYFVMPIAGETTKKFSAAELQYSQTYEDWRLHTAIDIKADANTPVNSAGDGKVTNIYEDTMLGKVVEIDHGNEIVALYCGLDTVVVEVDDVVSANEQIGVVGTVPNETKEGIHLHLEVKQNGKYIDPLKLMQTE